MHGTGLTHATLSAGLPCVSRGADAHEGANQVLAGHAFAGAVVQSGFALIVVWETNDTSGVRENHQGLRHANTHQWQDAPWLPARRPCGLCCVWSWSVNSDVAKLREVFHQPWRFPPNTSVAVAPWLICQSPVVNSHSNGYTFQIVSSSLETRNT